VHAAGEQVEVLAGLVGELVLDVLAQPLRQVRDPPQRRLEIVRGDVGELVELGVRALELGAESRELFGLRFGAGAGDLLAHVVAQ
jgi:hypothetical protein